jgi:ParB family chromosome partitioning protein
MWEVLEMAFDLGELLKDVSKSDTREQIEYIKLELIDGDEQNFYELSDVEALADNIATIGLQQPLRLRPHPTAEGCYVTVSGHRRRAALQLLAQEEPERWEEVACIVDRDIVSPALQQLRLIFGNANTRKMSSADLSEQAAQVEKLLYQLKEDGYEFPGRMRDHVAKVVQTSKTKLAKLKMIRDNLAPCWQPDYKKNVLGESSAYELSRLPLGWQNLLFEEKQRTKANIRWLYADDVKKFAERCAAIVACPCSETDDGVCTNQERKMRKAAVAERYYPCCCDKCCAECSNLASCKNACPKLKDRVAKIKAEAKEKRRQEQLAQEERDRPAIEQLKDLWYRFGVARRQAEQSVSAVYDAVEMYYVAAEDKKVEDKEGLWAEFSTNTTLPYGYSFYLSDARKLIAVADLLGCSLDYLFCRTDAREVAQDASSEKVSKEDTESATADIVPGKWYPPSVEPPVGAKIIVMDGNDYVDDDEYKGAGNLKYDVIKWPNVVRWTLMPNKED